MKTILLISLITIFFILSAIHIYWAFDGQWGLANALPSTSSGTKTLNPSIWSTLVVAAGLFLFGVFYLLQLGAINFTLLPLIQMIAKWMIPSIFLLRSMGDFKYVGFFKSIRGTDFAHLDTAFYSPLCLFLGLVGYFIAYRIN